MVLVSHKKRDIQLFLDLYGKIKIILYKKTLKFHQLYQKFEKIFSLRLNNITFHRFVTKIYGDIILFWQYNILNIGYFHIEYQNYFVLKINILKL